MICDLCEKHKRNNKGSSICGACQTTLRRFRVKLAAIKLAGGKCVECGWSGDSSGFDFHHRDSSQKLFELNSPSNHSWKSVKAEIKKCDLLCAICHRKVHNKRSEKFMKRVYSYRGSLDF